VFSIRTAVYFCQRNKDWFNRQR